MPVADTHLTYSENLELFEQIRWFYTHFSPKLVKSWMTLNFKTNIISYTAIQFHHISAWCQLQAPRWSGIIIFFMFLHWHPGVVVGVLLHYFHTYLLVLWQMCIFVKPERKSVLRLVVLILITSLCSQIITIQDDVMRTTRIIKIHL